MEQGHLFTQLSVVISVAAVISAVMRLFKQPLIIGYIFTGILVGPVLGLLKDASTLESFSKIGIALLLFIVGLGLNPRVVKELGKASLVVGTLQVLVTTALASLIMIGFGRSATTAILIGVSVSFSSTIVGLKLLSDKKEQTRLYGKLAIGVLLVQDLIATIALLALSTRAENFSALDIVALLFKGVLIAGLLFFFANKVFPKLSKFVSGSTEFLFLAAIAWGFGVAALFEAAGFSLEIGALIAGVCLASQNYSQEITSRLRPVRDFFIVIFFIFLGANIQIGDLLSELPIAIIISALVLVAKPLLFSLPFGYFGHTRRNSFKAGVLMAQISEFSLIFMILARNLNLVDKTSVSLVTLIALFTIAVSCYLIDYDDGIFNRLQKRIKFFESGRQDKTRERVKYYDIIQFGYTKGGAELIKAFSKIGGRHNLIVVDYNPEVIEALEQQQIHFMYGDAADAELLEEVGVETAKIVVSTMSHFPTTKFLIEFVEKNNPNAVIIVQANSPEEAAELYGLGASYVIVPHFVGSERLSNFISRHGFKKREFEKHKERHLAQLQANYSLPGPDPLPDDDVI
jgi:Kef-type K+ transport system membrane component KefB/Trk K+ transport system NAD-binding subunit